MTMAIGSPKEKEKVGISRDIEADQIIG